MIATESLITFVAIIDGGSFSAAAERLQQTPSAISRTLSRLEQQLGVRLLTRTTRRLELTEEGRWLLTRARAILAQLEEAQQQLQQHAAQPSGLLRINAATPVLNHLLAPLIPGFMARYPQIRLELTAAEAVIDLIAEGADIAIRVGALADSTLNARRLGDSPLRLVAAPGYLARCGQPLHSEDLAGHTLLGFSNPASLNLWPLAQQQQAGISIAPALSCSSGETLRHLALAGAGIACLADFLVGADLAAGRLLPVLPAQTLPWQQPLWAVFYKQGVLAPRVSCFVDYVAAALAGSGTSPVGLDGIQISA